MFPYSSNMLHCAVLTEEDLQRLTKHNQLNDKVITGTCRIRHTL